MALKLELTFALKKLTVSIAVELQLDLQNN